jgi:hypothetical protein
MRERLRPFLTFLVFACVLAIATASKSKLLDEALLGVVLLVFLLGSIVQMNRSFKSHLDQRDPGVYSGQISWLPASWQRWILGEDKEHRKQ